jgi:HPt (histidine-containing phosphotransfer) domain-containing protein
LSPASLEAAIQQHARRRQALAAARPKTAVPPAERMLLHFDSEASAPLCDPRVALQRLGGDTELLAELSHMFLARVDRDLLQLEESLQSGDAARLGKLAHALRGAASSLGGERASQVAAQIETDCGTGDMAAAFVRVPELTEALQGLARELKKATPVH